MKKLLAMLLALMMICSLSVTAFAAEEISDEPISITEDGVAPASVLSISFSNLAAGSRKLSSEVYYIEDEDAMLKISSATWAPASQNIWIGWYNVDTGVEYYVEYSGGDVSSRRINSNGVPDGDYKIFVKNVGTRAVTGALQYSVN